MSLRSLRAPARSRGAFLETLSAGSTIRQACEQAGIGRSTVYGWRSEDAAFALAWDEALEAGTDRLEEAAWKRAVEGVPRPLYQRGEQVGETLEYSDRLLELLLKARRPERYRERLDVRSVNVQIPAAELRQVREAARRHPEVFEELARQLASGGEPAAPTPV